jgi:sugar/nucleoside kinase (ribokinase family)
MAHQSTVKPIGIIGNLNIDLIIRNVPDLPAWGQEVMGSDRLQACSGQAGYLAFALRRLGIPITLIANLGDDLYGRQILQELTTFDVDLAGVEVTPNGRTGITVAIVRADGERAFVSDLGCLADFSEQMIQQRWSLLDDAAFVCLVGLFCLPGLSLAAASRQMARARQAGKITMLDTGWDPANWPATTLDGMHSLLKHISLFMPNWDEARAITGATSVEEAGESLCKLGPETVVIKCGELGSFARQGGYSCWSPPRVVQVQDAVGAGDVFNAGFLYALQQGWPLEACLAWGNSTASLYISATSDRFPQLAEVIAAGRDYPALAALFVIDR